MGELFIILLLIGLCSLVGNYAQSKGRSFILFFILSMFLTPIVGFIIAVVASNEKKIDELKATIDKNN